MVSAVLLVVGRRVLERYPNNGKLLRCYGKFLEDVKHDPATAARVYGEASRNGGGDAILNLVRACWPIVPVTRGLPFVCRKLPDAPIPKTEFSPATSRGLLAASDRTLLPNAACSLPNPFPAGPVCHPVGRRQA